MKRHAWLLVTVPLMLSAADARAGAPSSTRSVRIHIVEQAPGTARRNQITREFVVSLGGRVAGWTELGGAERYCRIAAEPTADGQTRVDVRCGTASGNRAYLEVRAERALSSRKDVVAGEVGGPGGTTTRVLARLD